MITHQIEFSPQFSPKCTYVHILVISRDQPHLNGVCMCVCGWWVWGRGTVGYKIYYCSYDIYILYWTNWGNWVGSSTTHMERRDQEGWGHHIIRYWGAPNSTSPKIISPQQCWDTSYCMHMVTNGTHIRNESRWRHECSFSSWTGQQIKWHVVATQA